MSDPITLRTLKQQYAYRLDVDIEKGNKIIGSFGKNFYEAKWKNRKDSSIVLLEIKGDNFNEEVLLYVTLDHPNIIKTYGLVEPNRHTMDFNSILLLQEYASDGDLWALLNERYFIPSQYVLIEIFIQISNAMKYLAEHDIIHGDLACRNVLVIKSDAYEPKKNSVKLIDFGLTRHRSSKLDKTADIPVRYAALEILRNHREPVYSQLSDVYSFGVLMWEACSFGKIPFLEINDNEEVRQQKLNGKTLARPEKCDPNTWKLMLLCWNDEPNRRPRFDLIYMQLKGIQDVQSLSLLHS